MKNYSNHFILVALSCCYFLLIACGGGGSSSGSSDSSTSTTIGAPVIRNFSVNVVGPRMVQASADVSHVDGGLDNVSIEWGDGAKINFGADSFVQSTHTYDSAGTFVVTIIATDNRLRRDTESIQVTVVDE